MKTLVGLAIAVSASAAWAAPKKDAPKKDDAAKTEPAPDAAKAEADAPPDIPHIEGPKLVDLGSNTEITVPAGMWLVERAEAVKIQEKLGNDTSELVALVADPK